MKKRSTRVTVSDIDFEVEYYVCPAEPDVGIPFPYVELIDVRCNSDIMWTDDVEATIISEIEMLEVDLYYDRGDFEYDLRKDERL